MRRVRTQELSRAGRTTRTAAFAVGLALLLAGTAWGQDDHFPFGPFRMYSTADDPDGAVLSTYLQAVDADGVVVDRVSTLKPWRIRLPRRGTAGVLELPAGALDATGTQLGHRIELAAGGAL